MAKSKSYKLYNSYQTSRMTEAEIRKEYSKLRSVANKRLGRLEAQDIGMKARTGYKFPTIEQIESSSKSTVASELADVSKWLYDKRSTVTGEKKFLREVKESFTEKGYGSLVDTVDDIYNVIEMLEDRREKHQDRLYSSSDLLDTLKETERLNLPYDKIKENIDIFVQNLESLESVKPTKGGRTFSSSRVDALIRKWKK